MVLTRITIGAVLGALAGAALLTIASSWHRRVDVDLSTAGVVRGAYPGEYAGGDLFHWTGPNIRVDLSGLDRRIPWSCSVRVRGARADVAALPLVRFSADGAALAERQTTNEYQDVAFTLPPAAAHSGAELTLVSSTTFVPGPGDRRTLGVQLREWTCAASGRGPIVPPGRALWSASIAAAIFGAVFSLIGLTIGRATAAAAAVAAAQAAVLVRGLGMFAPYAERLPWLAGWIAVALAALASLIEWRASARLSHAARFVAAWSGAALYLKLLALLHPSTPLVDAVFHAHRFEAVLAGHFYFTQPISSGLEFPYAIGLYLFAAPWSFLTHDHVSLLRIVVCAWEAASGAMLYWAVVRVWGDRLAGAAAVAFFSCVPIAAWVVRNANLTNAFGQSAALGAAAVAIVWPFGRRHVRQTIGLAALLALTFLSHVSTFALSFTMTVALAALLAWRGGSAGRSSARSLAVAAVVAAVFSIAIYYGHFGPVYAKVLHSRAAAVARTPTVAPAATAAGPAMPSAAADGVAPLSVRTANALMLAVAAFSWPVLLFAAVGAWRVWRDGWRDRLALALAAWGVAFVAFFALGIAAPVDAANQRYAAEFVGRVAYGTYPAAVLLAARGGSWTWSRGPLVRLGAVIVALAAVRIGVASWLGI